MNLYYIRFLKPQKLSDKLIKTVMNMKKQCNFYDFHIYFLHFIKRIIPWWIWRNLFSPFVVECNFREMTKGSCKNFLFIINVFFLSFFLRVINNEKSNLLLHNKNKIDYLWLQFKKRKKWLCVCNLHLNILIVTSTTCSISWQRKWREKYNKCGDVHSYLINSSKV